MSGSRSKKLIHAEELIKAGKVEEVLEIVLKFGNLLRNSIKQAKSLN